MVLLEAMAAGVPVICNCGGGREVVEDAGLLVQLWECGGFPRMRAAAHVRHVRPRDRQVTT